MASAPAPTLNINASHTELTLAENQPVGRETPKLIWADEFDAPQLDPQRWFFESGDGSQYGIPGWGNNEQQWYLPDSATLEDGHLVITAREQAVQFAVGVPQRRLVAGNLEGAKVIVIERVKQELDALLGLAQLCCDTCIEDRSHPVIRVNRIRIALCTLRAASSERNRNGCRD